MTSANNNIRTISIMATLSIAILSGVYGLKVKGWAGLADLSLNISAAAAGSAVTVFSLEALLKAGERRKKQRFMNFFGKTALEKDFKLICSKRELANPSDGGVFKYSYGNKLFSGLPPEITPTPKDVKAWLAYDDMLVAAKMGRLFGLMGRQVQIALDNDNDNWNDSPTIAIGLGFTLHTRKLLSSSALNRWVDVKWPNSLPLSDAIYFDGHDYSSGDENEDYALLARIICEGETVHFICAGRTAPGTAAAGRYLAEKWEDISKLYLANNKSLATVDVAILIRHPPTFEQVRNAKISEFKQKDVVFASNTVRTD
jgi:hypothetical protein